MSLTGHHMPLGQPNKAIGLESPIEPWLAHRHHSGLQALRHGTKNAATDGPGSGATPRSRTEPHRGWMSDNYLLHLHAEGEKCFLLTSPFIEPGPARASLAVAIQMLKQIVSYQLHKLAAGGPFWQARYYDFNVWSERKRIEKLRYIHRNPVKRGLVESPEQWAWSSFRHYISGVEGMVEIESQWTARKRERLGLALQIIRWDELPRPVSPKPGETKGRAPFEVNPAAKAWASPPALEALRHPKTNKDKY